MPVGDPGLLRNPATRRLSHNPADHERDHVATPGGRDRDRNGVERRIRTSRCARGRTRSRGAQDSRRRTLVPPCRRRVPGRSLETVRKGSRAATGASIVLGSSGEIGLLRPVWWHFEVSVAGLSGLFGQFEGSLLGNCASGIPSSRKPRGIKSRPGYSNSGAPRIRR